MADEGLRREPKTARSKRAMAKREPKLIEDRKNVMLLRGTTGGSVTSVLADLHLLLKPNVVNFKKKMEKRPFEDATSVEFLSQKNDTSLFVYGSHSKKRPSNLVFGRLFDYHMLDMLEVGIERFRTMGSFKNQKFATGSKPCLVFQGQEFESDPETKSLKNVLIDLFRGPVISGVNLAGLDHVIAFTSLGEKRVQFNHYRPILLKSGTRLPRVELEEIGPSFVMVLRREWHAADDVQTEAYKQAKGARKRKNIEHSVAAGEILGRVHMEKQDLSKAALFRPKAFGPKGKKGKKDKGEGKGRGEGKDKDKAEVEVEAGDVEIATRTRKRQKRSV